MRTLLSAAFFLAFSMCLNGMPNRNPVANADEHGYAKFTKIDFPLDAKDRLLMFYLEFNSDPVLEPGMHGAFWHIPAFYSKLAPVNGDEFNWLAPNGVTYYFCGHGIKKQGVDGAKSDTYTDNTGIWVATKKKNDVRIESLKDKSSFIYRNGRLLAFTVKGEKYNVRYAGVRGAVSSVSGESDSNAGLTFEYYDDLRHVKSIKTCKGVYKFKYHGRTPEDILGDDKAFSEVRLLSEIEYPDGKIQKIAYSRKPSVPRIRLSGNFSEEKADSAPVNRMNFKDPSGESGEWIEWFAKSGIISADSSGPYMVGSEADFEGRPGPRFIAIKHINPLKKHPHLYLFDRDNRFEIIGNPDSGEVLRYSKTGGCGNNAHERQENRKAERRLFAWQSDMGTRRYKPFQ